MIKIIFFLFCLLCFSSRSFLWNRFHYKILLLITNIVYCIQMVSLLFFIFNNMTRMHSKYSTKYRVLQASFKYSDGQLWWWSKFSFTYLYLFKPKLFVQYFYIIIMWHALYNSSLFDTWVSSAIYTFTPTEIVKWCWT